MDQLRIEATKRTPDIFFDCQNNLLEIRGRSYPADISEYYTPVFSWLEEYLEQLDDKKCTVNIDLTYFNSSSSKTLLDFFTMLEEAVRKGKSISVNWIYDAEDEDNLEYGEDFQEDLELLTFNLVQKEG
ncbi:DUF1987 domain-containing protein [Desulfonema magnum]|uniref:DUF1987 n=1 Tax=Desulfonema magnum TaxID=45655 RepID=A0A975BIQ7_9BACT|nr:DUF1987 domain-containing protein [Desulfonema magnum]QTA86078.1 DUF1987 [Desulfonema magnum]